MATYDRPIYRKAKDYRWDGVDERPYKEDDRALFKTITRQVLFSAPEMHSELRYFQMAPGSFSTLARQAATADAGGFGGAAEECRHRGLPAQRAASGADVTRARRVGPMPFHVRLGVPAAIVVGWLAGGFSCALAAEPPSADQRAFVDIYRELIEINTTDSIGDTLRAAEAMAARLRAGGIPVADIKVLSSGPRKGNLVARLRGTGARRP